MEKKSTKIVLVGVIFFLIVSLLGCPEEEQVYSVAFDTNGGTPISDQSIRENDRAFRPETIPIKNGYTFDNWYEDNDTFLNLFNFDTPITEDTTIYAKWNLNASYTVEHWKQNLNDDGYTITIVDTDVLKGPTGAMVTASAKTYTGFSENTSHLDRITNGTINEDGSLLLKLYYDRDTFTVSFDENGGSEVSDISVRYGATISELPSSTKDGYSFDGWYIDGGETQFTTSTEVTDNIAVYAKWNSGTTTYTVEHWQQNINDDGYTKVDTDTLEGTTDTMVTASAKTYTGFSENTSHLNRVNNGIISGDESMVLKLYYDRDTFTVSFDENGGSDVSAISIRYGATISELPSSTKDGYSFEGWYTSTDGGTQFTVASEVTEAILVHAKWSKKLTLTELKEMITDGDDVTSVNTSGITDMSNLFEGNDSFNQDISSWDVSNVENMSNMFKNASSFNKDISSWDVGNVANHSNFSSGTCPLYRNFHPGETWWDEADKYEPDPIKRDQLEYYIANYEDNDNIDLSTLNTSEITDMSGLFEGKSTFNEDISSWDVSSVTNMRRMFSGASSFNQDLSSWDVSNVENMSYMFNKARVFNGNISTWNVKNVENMNNMFCEAEAFNGNISSWKVESVTNMEKMFKKASNFNQDLNSWDVSNVENMSYMFHDASAFNGNISSWDVSSVINMLGMFNSAVSFNQNLYWNVSNVTNMSNMFGSAKAFNGDISSWNVGKVEKMTGMFYSALVFNGNISGWDVSNVTNMSGMFAGTNFFNGNISSWTVSSVKDMSSMFLNAFAFNQDISSWSVDNVTNMESMFNNASSFNQNISGWNVDKVTNHADFSISTCPLFKDYHPDETWADDSDGYSSE